MKCFVQYYYIIFIALMVGVHGSIVLAIDTDIIEKNMVIVIPSYNNKLWYKKNLNSVLSQKYANFRVIYIDDCSPDGTGSLVQEYIEKYDRYNRITLFKNNKRQGVMANRYHAIHSCVDSDIIVTLDGDDWLAHDKVLKVINEQYQDPNVWITYGQYQKYPLRQKGQCKQFDQEVIIKNSYRDYFFVSSHLRTFYAWLFKLIKKEDLLYNDQFIPMATDVAIMLPMLEMAGGRFKCIEEVLYMYNVLNPINMFMLDPIFQKKMEFYIRSKKRYEPLGDIILRGK
ncbi:MAG: glycosyltransferase family 2 protein [Candidatus Dependentiae bacterium]|nr:glycosyltransferase family 2 protein [Candidatus Dependentiae bacterium]